MSETLEQRLADAFDAIRAPEAAQQQALAAIEAARAEAPAPAPVPAPSPAMPTAARGPRPASRRAARLKGALAAAACLLVVALGVGGYQLYEQPVAYVGIDVNPSMELSVNRFDVVVGARAVNDDGAAVLSEVALEGRPYGQALDLLMASPTLSACLSDDALVEISVTSDSERVSDQLVRASDDVLAQHSCHGAAACADEATRQAAAAAGMGTARYRAACDLMELDPEVTLEGCASLSMRELRERIASHHGALAAASGEGGAVAGGQDGAAGSEGGQQGGRGQALGYGQGCGRQQGAGHGADHGHGEGCGRG